MSDTTVERPRLLRRNLQGPVVGVGRFAAPVLGFLFLFAAVTKVAQLGDFANTLSAIIWLPPWVRRTLVLGVPLSEVSCVSLLAFPPLRRTGLAACSVLLVAFTCFLIREALSPTEVVCNCFGGLSQYLNANLGAGGGIGRNVALLFVAGAGLVHEAGSRPGSAAAAATQAAGPARLAARPAAAGLTLVELLVVIGVIGLLLAILLPTLGRARRAAQSVACAAHQREIAAAALSAAADHRGFLQLDGEVWVPASAVGYGTLAPALHDAKRARYAYWRETNHSPTAPPPPVCEESPVPLSVFLYARLAGVALEDLGVSYTAVAPDHEALGRDAATAALFDCPANDRSPTWSALATVGRPSLITFCGGLGTWTPWWTRFDYATNGVLLGFKDDPPHTPRPPRRLAGRLAGVRQASNLLLLSDTTAGLMWSPPPNASASVVTLADVRDPAEGLESYGASLRRAPHDGRFNAAFVDGHCQTALETDEGLAGVVLSPAAE